MRELINGDVREIFRIGSWAVTPVDKLMYVHTIYNYVVSHNCKERGFPWFWGHGNNHPCPDCGELCPDGVSAVFEMMK